MWGSMRKILGCKDSDILGTVIIHSWINCDWFDLITLPLCYFIGIKQSHEEILYKIRYLIISKDLSLVSCLDKVTIVILKIPIFLGISAIIYI